MTRQAKGFNFNGRRYTYTYTRGMSLDLAREKLDQRRRLAPDYLWAINKTSDGTYGLGRAVRKGKMANQRRLT